MAAIGICVFQPFDADANTTGGVGTVSCEIEKTFSLEVVGLGRVPSKVCSCLWMKVL